MDDGEIPTEPPEGDNDVVTITQTDYYSGENVHIDTQSNGSADPSVTLTASPGGVMEPVDLQYHIYFPLSGCPCEVTITSSEGGSATVTVGP